MITLVVEGARPITFPLSDSDSEIVAGSLPENSIYLPYKGISRRHFSLFKKKNSWWIRDLGSKNGTAINGKSVIESAIDHGDMIQAGTLQIRVESSDEEIQSIEPVSEESMPGESQETDRVGVLRVKDADPIYSFPNLVFPEDLIPCKSAAMLEVYQRIHAVSRSDVNVMLVGETGTGKEMMATMIHLSSNRGKGPFVAINCAAIPEDLAETELFGIGEKVATNVNQRKGKMTLADKGTLFLDELSAFPYPLQAKILRAVQDKSITPIGENKSISVNFRLISATNQEPNELVRDQKLREDLYHRLATIEVDLPPLRERKEDIQILVPALLYKIAKKEDKRISGISKKMMNLLMAYSYPGNIRELINILRSMVALAHPGEILDVHLIPEKILQPQSPSDTADLGKTSFGEKPYDLRKAMADVTKDLIVQALTLHHGNVKKAAAHLKVTTFGLRKMMKRLGIEK
jgi:transcriptional regulator with PAS, ATPase and Fis domain